MDDKLTFDNLYELLDKFASTSDVNKSFAQTMHSEITNSMHILLLMNCVYSMFLL